MRKIRTILMFTFTFFLLTMSAAAQKAPAPDYFPLRVGDSWTYRSTADGSEFTIKVLSEEKQADGTILYLLEKQAGAVIRTWYSKANGFVNILREAYEGHELQIKYDEKPRLHLKLPLVAGATWTWAGKSTTQMDMTEASKVVGLETVVVPAGTFRAMKIETQVSEGPAGVLKTYWYADGVGLVKSTSDSGQIKYGFELADYSFKKAAKTPAKAPAKKPASPRRRPR